MRQLLLLLVVLLLPACSGKPLVVKHAEAFSDTGQHEIYIVSHGWHTGFVLPANVMYHFIPQLKKRFGNTHAIEVGWGDKGFYQAKKITSGLTIRAIFWPTETVIHTVSVPSDVKAYFPDSKIRILCLSDNELASLVQFISDSFARDSKGNIELEKNGIYGDSQFYSGVGSYYLMNTCNKWTAKGLKSTGLDISPTFKLTAGSVMSYLTDRVYRDRCTGDAK
ncbi:MAG: TIGR02117 family protein [Candidatus Electrothrix scaldis]|nr:MAG: TIGR02117 family protein [Candidatus Electrothrix sp. GW3-3]